VAAPARARAIAKVLAGLAGREVRALGARNGTDSAERGRARARAVRREDRADAQAAKLRRSVVGLVGVAL
jgi:hypothetical protein